MLERATTRSAATRTVAAPSRAPSIQPAAVVSRRSGSAPSGPPVLRLVAGARAGEPPVRDESLARLVASPGPGEPLAEPVRRQLESSLRVDLSPVRVHADERSRSVVGGIGARAFTWGRRIFLGPGERTSDVALIAHETAHVIQQQGAQRIQMSGGGGASDALEHEARQVSTAVAAGQQTTVTGRTSPRPQFDFGDWVKSKAKAVGSAVGGAVSAVADVVGDIAGAALSFIKDHARVIPGYDMLGFVLGRDPITQEPVPRNPVNLIKAVMGLWPAGSTIFDALQAHGIIDKVANWLDPQLKTLVSIVGGIRKALDQFISTLGPGDILHLGDAWNRAKRIFSEPIDRAGAFVKGLVSDVLGFIRDAILLPVAKLAEGTRGYDLLKAVLGKDPITGAAVPQDAMTLIGGFLKLIGEDEIFENMKKADALGRAFVWFNKALAELKLFVAQIPPTFITALKQLDVSDMILIPKAFFKLAKVFGGFLERFIKWAGGTIWDLLEIVFDVVSPGALEYVKKTGAALNKILKNPLPFVGNLVKAAKLGFEQFADHFKEHLKAALIDWLLGAIPGVYIPKAFELLEIVKFVLSVLGLTWTNIRGKLVKVLGETVVTAMETGFKIVVTLVKDGPAAAWEEMKAALADLKDQVISGIIGMVVDTIVKKAVPKLIALFIPGAGFISAIVSIYETVMVFVNKIKTIIQVVKGFIDSIVDIANGVIGAAANKVESTLAKLMSLAIAFLAGFLSLGGIADKIRGVLEKIRGTVDKGLEAVVAWIVKIGKAFVGSVKKAVKKWWTTTKTVDIDGETATLYFEGEEDNAKPFIKSSPGQPISNYLRGIKSSTPAALQPKLIEAQGIATKLEERRPKGADVEDFGNKRVDLYNKLAPLLKELGATRDVPPSVVTYGSIQAEVGGASMEAKLLTKKHQPGSTPSESWPLWKALDPFIGKAPHYVRGHLLNENVGGKGQILNLTPITTKANAGHKTSVETKVKQWVADDKVVYYSVKAEYGRAANKTQDQKDLEDELSTSGKLSSAKAAKLAALDARRKLCKRFVFKAYVMKPKPPWTEDTKAKDPYKKISDSVDNE